MTDNFGYASAPSNIALLKYWGRDKFYTPLNPSISMTLGDLRSFTKVTISDSDNHQLHIGGRAEKIDDKLLNFLSKMLLYFKEDFKFKIESTNTFPMSAGIASSASGYAALCAAIFNFFDKTGLDDKKLDLMRIFALNGSKSSLRSLVKNKQRFVLLDNNRVFSIANHKSLNYLYDFVVCVDDTPKKVSSSEGHKLVQKSIFNSIRVNYAKNRCEELLLALTNGDFEVIQNIAETDAILMHASVAESVSNFMYLTNKTEIVISELINSRKGRMVFWTCDAGANVHLVFHPKELPYIQSLLDYIKGFVKFDVYSSKTSSGILLDNII